MEEKTNILIVEDDYEIARIMKDHLDREGFQVTWASTGVGGWELRKLYYKIRLS
ncbi:hypothetical protein [Oceanobacillus neutriphilus]|uniref:Response regulatory domain-containing protein n=1 Tax=Oceanobacillus neutriphilus TaxID=531815 RepID=A0ABQ2NRW4_9BACI|nr:hypothetical protein [Oceanobacillus neutriphilus]GGP09094.1 hypothetical protein GCM10011346_11770 [Oceanobacillus neutriphilus]